MSDTGLWDRLLPILSLLLGAWLTRLAQRPNQRREAANMLAGVMRQVWSRSEEGSWLDLQEYLGKMWFELRTAGVPRTMIDRLESAAIAFWQATEDSGDPDVGRYVLDKRISDELEQIRADTYDWLDSPWRPWRRRQLRRATESRIA